MTKKTRIRRGLKDAIAWDITAVNQKLLFVSLSSAVLVFAASINVAAQSCKELQPINRFSLPPGQLAAAVEGESKAVETPTKYPRPSQGNLASTHISLARTICYGPCPDYTVEIDGKGAASFFGRNSVLLPRKLNFKISEQSVQCLLSHFQQANFWALKDGYVADVADVPTYRLTLTIGDQTKSVEDHLGSEIGMPGLVAALEDDVDRVAGVDRWVKGNADTLPGLRDAHFNFKSKEAATLLANAAAGASPDFINELIEAGAPVTGRAGRRADGKRPTAIEQASGAGRVAVVQALIAKGALADGLQDTTDGALRAAARSGVPEIVNEILKHQPNVNAQDGFGNTALLFAQNLRKVAKDASASDIPAVIQILLSAGADPNIANGSGATALFHSRYSEAVRLLTQAGADVNVHDNLGWTPLLTAESDDVALSLIAAGADINAVSKSGLTVGKFFKISGYTKAIRFLSGNDK